jgi:hypothetical protein
MRAKPFMGIDGEGYTVDGEHRYVLLMDSERRYIYDDEGLPTKACLDFLLDLPKDSIPVAFGLNYDVNMILRDLGRQTLKQLWDEGSCHWGPYHLEWIPGKWFAVKRFTENPDCRWCKGTGSKMVFKEGKKPREEKCPRCFNSTKVNETFGFFQMRFTAALEKWNITVQDSDELEEMKGARSIFDPQMRDRVIDYCHTECCLLVDLLDALRKALLAVDIRLTSWNGAGSIAASLLRREGVKQHLVPHTELPEEVQHASLAAYFGGRTELFQQGEFPTVSQYDIRSAYPHAALSLPSLVGGAWVTTETYDPTADHALWDVEWSIPEGVLIAPFPYRSKGRICYPLNGRGWYHSAEVTQALLHHQEFVTVREGVVFQPFKDCAHPFDFIPHIFTYRRQLQREGHAGEKCLKLGINSLYGKLAQGVGYRDSLPPFQSYFWAGEITARTRARLSEAMHKAPDQLLMVATDGVFFKGEVDIPVSESLGGWERTLLSEAFTAQPGVYCAIKGETEIKRSRGFFAKEIDFQALRTGYQEDGCNFIGHYSSTRFVGAGTALMSKDLSAWRTWREGDRKLSLYPSTKFVEDMTARPIIHKPPSVPEPAPPSEPYKPKIKGYGDDEIDYTQAKEQPLR